MPLDAIAQIQMPVDPPKELDLVTDKGFESFVLNTVSQVA
jgi:hypothetical protein